MMVNIVTTRFQKACVKSAETWSSLFVFCSVLLPMLFLDNTFLKCVDESKSQ